MGFSGTFFSSFSPAFCKLIKVLHTGDSVHAPRERFLFSVDVVGKFTAPCWLADRAHCVANWDLLHSLNINPEPGFSQHLYLCTKNVAEFAVRGLRFQQLAVNMLVFIPGVVRAVYVQYFSSRHWCLSKEFGWLSSCKPKECVLKSLLSNSRPSVHLCFYLWSTSTSLAWNFYTYCLL